MDDVGATTTRRRVLTAATTGIAGALAGCTENLWSRAESPGPEQVSLTIKAVPADDDVVAAKIASKLRENFQAAGIDATFEPTAKAELYREVLLDGEYDVFVARCPELDEYDGLRGLLHSKYVSERGWQNPFHFSDVTVDELLESQLTSEGEEREQSLSELFEHLTETVPYAAVAFPHRIGATRDELSISVPPRESLDYAEIVSQEPDEGSREGPLEVGVFGEQLTGRLNPIVVDRNAISGLVELVYSPLVYRIDDEDVPWLADDVEWESGSRLRATVTLHDDSTWHDGESLDADDVAFTYQFLEDTSLGEAESGIPAPRYRSQQSLVENVAAVDDRTVEFTFETGTQSIAARALRVPLLPEHIWEPRSSIVGERQTEALVDDNEDPIGSGLFTVDDVTEDAEVELGLFDDHVFRDETADRPSILEDFPQFEGIRFQVAPNAGALVDLLAEGEVDLTGSPLPADETSTILENAELSALTEPTEEFYMIGYNGHHQELGYPNFRRILSRLIDREHAVDQIFAGFADPARTRGSLFGIKDTELAADEDTVITNFPGSDGEVDSSQVRSLFEDEGYGYDDGALLE
ncbi:ABC transporter substrate-binding protein [Natronococcus pandeyae]|uniref:ABC transporter substrate-binding protein n=1 Tax=Natronococcus pandeyae TaxID=2055836 RepID=A0A8J8Q4N9_9EURY|nr:ABC transporter substrate-binding protein [Natronococcus pandeyae]TYL37140.1 ABC transporter substrate-binding protein [Natronococcus pandeyae]